MRVDGQVLEAPSLIVVIGRRRVGKSFLLLRRWRSLARELGRLEDLAAAGARSRRRSVQGRAGALAIFAREGVTDELWVEALRMMCCS